MIFPPVFPKKSQKVPMNLNLLVARVLGAIAAMFFVSGCNKVDETTITRGSNNRVAFVIETSLGGGPVSSDYTVISAVLEGDKEGKKVLVLSGENLVIKKFTWTDANNVYICLKGGITDRYVNLVLVGPLDTPVNVHNHLVEDC